VRVRVAVVRRVGRLRLGRVLDISGNSRERNGESDGDGGGRRRARSVSRLSLGQRVGRLSER
jgi:hypothetical protein